LADIFVTAGHPAEMAGAIAAGRQPRPQRVEAVSPAHPKQGSPEESWRETRYSVETAASAVQGLGERRFAHRGPAQALERKARNAAHGVVSASNRLAELLHVEISTQATLAGCQVPATVAHVVRECKIGALVEVLSVQQGGLICA
jgi:hypothetical protein